MSCPTGYTGFQSCITSAMQCNFTILCDIDVGHPDEGKDGGTSENCTFHLVMQSFNCFAK